MNIKNLAVLGMAASLVACGTAETQSNEIQGPAGELTFELTFNQGVEINSVEGVCYIADATVPGGRRNILEKTINVSGIEGTSFSAFWGALEVSDSWVCELTAESTDRRLVCSGARNNIRVRNGETTEITVDVQCIDNTPRGNILVTGEFNTCPDINDFEIFPISTVAGTSVNVQASASDLDGDTIAFRWTVAPSNLGTFSSPNAARGLFTCDLVGTGTITLTVDDGRGCGFRPGNTVAEAESFRVACTAAGICGDGNINAGELCDNGDLMPVPFPPGELCTPPSDPRGGCVLKFCGDGQLDDQILPGNENPGASPPVVREECDDGNNTPNDGCAADCDIEFCGDGVVQTGLAIRDATGAVVPGTTGLTEQCDDAADPLCDARCQTVQPGQNCGDGVVQTIEGEACDDGDPTFAGTTAPFNGQTDCGTNCQFRYSSTCIAAEQANCAAPRAGVFSNPNPTINTPPIPAAQRNILAADLLVCLRTTRCSTSQAPDDFFRCLCGSTAPTTCINFEPGPASVPNTDIGTDFVNTKAGAANGLCIAELIAALGPRFVPFVPAQAFATSVAANISAASSTSDTALNDVLNLDTCTQTTPARAACN